MAMVTGAAGEDASLSAQLGALSIAVPPASGAVSFSSEVHGEANGRGHGGGGGLPRKGWQSPPRIAKPDALFMGEPSSSWPVPSRDVSSNKKKHQNSQKGSPHRESVSNGDVGTCSAETTPKEGALASGRSAQAMDPVAVGSTRTETMPSKAGHDNPRPSRPPLRLPAQQQQARPPLMNGHRGRNQQQLFPPHHHNGHHSGACSGGGRWQQQRPRYQGKIPINMLPHQQQVQLANGQGFGPIVIGLYNPSTYWGFNQAQNLPWGPSAYMNTTHMNTIAPPGSMFPRGYFPGPYPTDGFPYPAPPVLPILPPPLVQNTLWFMAPPPAPPVEAAVHSRVGNPLLPRGGQWQPPPQTPQQVDEGVHDKLRSQIEYYFSDENLVKDLYLKMCMDEEGWVSVHIIATFPRVRSLTGDMSVIMSLTGDMSLIMEALRTSATLDVSMEKIRRRNGWQRYLLKNRSILGLSQAILG